MKSSHLNIIYFILTSMLWGQWEKVSLDLGYPNAIIEYKDKIYIGGGFKGIYISEDDGNSWTVMKEGIIANSFETNSFFISDGLYACTTAGVYKLNEINKIWEKVFEYSAFSMYKKDENVIIVNNNIGLIISNDNGQTWKFEKNDPYIIYFNIIKFRSQLYCTSNAGLFRSNDSGETWEKINSGYFRKLFIEDSILYALQGWNLTKTFDDGYTWIEVQYFYNNIFDYLKYDNKKIVSSFEKIYCKIENDSEWRPVLQNFPDKINGEIGKVLFAHEKYLYLCNGNGLWRKQFSDFDLPAIKISGLEKDSCNIDEIFTNNFFIQNEGFDTLDISNIVSSNPNFTIIETKYNIPPGDAFGVLFKYYPNNAGTDSTTFMVYSNTKDSVINYTFNIYVIPSVYYMHQNYPNPFNAWTKIDYSISKPEFVSINIYNSLGQQIQTIANELQSGGKHSLYFNSEKLASGVYYYSINSGKFYDVKKMLLLK